jgi:hypothetical protein
MTGLPVNRPTTPRPTRESGAAILIRETSDQLFLVYTGGRQQIMGDPMRFFAEAGLMERNLVLFKEAQPAYYYRGISDRLDTFDRFLAWQRELCTRLQHVRRVFCIGSSMGAYAAILYGYHLRAEEVWAFSPQAEAREVLLPPDVPPHLRDLPRLLATSNGRTRYNIYYNRSSAIDHAEASRLSGADGVALCPQNGTGHRVVDTLIESGRLRSIFPEPS